MSYFQKPPLKKYNTIILAEAFESPEEAAKRSASKPPSSRTNGSRGVARILGKGVLEYARKILSHAHLLTVKVKV